MRAYRYHHLPSHAAPCALPVRISGQESAPSVDLSAVLAMAACLNHSTMDDLASLQPFLPPQEQIAFNAAVQARQESERMLQSAKIRTALGQQPAPGPVGSVPFLRTMSATQFARQAGLSAPLSIIANMQARVEAMRTQAEQLRRGQPQTLLPLLMQKMRERSPQQGQQADSAGNASFDPAKMVQMTQMMQSLSGANGNPMAQMMQMFAGQQQGA